MFGGYLIYHVVDKIEKLSYCYFDYSVQKKKKEQLLHDRERTLYTFKRNEFKNKLTYD